MQTVSFWQLGRVAALTLPLVAVSVTGHAAPSKPVTVANSAYLPKATQLNEQSDDATKVGYSLGYLMGDGNKDTVDDLQLDAFFQGFRDAYINKDPAISKAKMQQVLLDYQKRKEVEYAKQVEKMAVNNLANAKVFLATNGKKAGVKTTASGLQYQVIKAGTGAKPKASDKVKVHYEGRLMDDTIFDSSYKRGEPVTFPLNQVIKGWAEGVQLMNVGSKYRLFVPPNLGYGEAGNSDIEPNSLLIFDVELLDINPKDLAKNSPEQTPSAK